MRAYHVQWLEKAQWACIAVDTPAVYGAVGRAAVRAAQPSPHIAAAAAAAATLVRRAEWVPFASFARSRHATPSVWAEEMKWVQPAAHRGGGWRHFVYIATFPRRHRIRNSVLFALELNDMLINDAVGGAPCRRGLRGVVHGGRQIAGRQVEVDPKQAVRG